MGWIVARVEVTAIQWPSNNVPHFVGISQFQCLQIATTHRSTEMSKPVRTREARGGWERQQMSNLFSNEGLFVCLCDPIDFAWVGGVGEDFRLERFVESRRDRCRVPCNPQPVEPHPLSEARYKRINFDLKLYTQGEIGMISHSLTDGTNGPNPFAIPIHVQRKKVVGR